MSDFVWRIATDAPTYAADDLTGEGAKQTGGRWNKKGIPVLYTSRTRALACLETVVHLSGGGLPLNRYLVEIEIQDDVWTSAQVETVATLPVGWDAEPASGTSINFGSNWLASGTSALLIVPSVIVHEEFNVLINPAHPDITKISAKKVRRWLYDPRLQKGP